MFIWKETSMRSVTLLESGLRNLFHDDVARIAFVPLRLHEPVLKPSGCDSRSCRRYISQVLFQQVAEIARHVPPIEY